MRDEDRIRLQHMIEAAADLAQFIAGRTRADLDHDRQLLFAVVRAVEIFGEAASKITAETQTNAARIPWRQIIGMRNRLVHAYFTVDADVVWTTVTQEVPSLVPLLQALATSGS